MQKKLTHQRSSPKSRVTELIVSDRACSDECVFHKKISPWTFLVDMVSQSFKRWTTTVFSGPAPCCPNVDLMVSSR